MAAAQRIYDHSGSMNAENSPEKTKKLYNHFHVQTTIIRAQKTQMRERNKKGGQKYFESAIMTIHRKTKVAC